ncbi:hypothetical protein HKW98_09320 [Stutzerimonas urumqiensis]|uniref:hypothetical protein n=1 Tax=Stutzerimonas urumqiensis TaxID=638269 RepID=UPI003BAB93A9
MKRSNVATLTLAALLGLTLTGCEVAEESAQHFTEKAEQAMQELAHEAASDTLDALNEQIDKVQKSTTELLGRPDGTAEHDKPEPEAETPSALPEEGIET